MNKLKIIKSIQTTTIGKNVIYLTKVDSTNNEAKREIGQGAKNGTVIVAENQVCGKGRLGRTWKSNSGKDLSFSIILRSINDLSHVKCMSLLAGLSVCNVLIRKHNIDARVKWPNDIIINNKKVCGILCESLYLDNKFDVIVGIGVNANNTEFSKDIAHKATSMCLENGITFSRTDLLCDILYEFENLYLRMHNGFINIIDEYKQLCATIDKHITTVGGNKVSGVAFDISETGELMIRTDNGEILSINSSEVTVQGIY